MTKITKVHEGYTWNCSDIAIAGIRMYIDITISTPTSEISRWISSIGRLDIQCWPAFEKSAPIDGLYSEEKLQNSLF